MPTFFITLSCLYPAVKYQPNPDERFVPSTKPYCFEKIVIHRNPPIKRITGGEHFYNSFVKKEELPTEKTLLNTLRKKIFLMEEYYVLDQTLLM